MDENVAEIDSTLSAKDDAGGRPSRRSVLRGVAAAGATAIAIPLTGAFRPASQPAGAASAAAELPPPDLQLPRFVDPMPVPPVLRPSPRDPLLTVRMRRAEVRLHSQLPPTQMWTYDGHFPGPTIEVRRNQRLRVAWQNEISGPLPLDVVELPDEVPGRPPGVPIADYPGLDGAQPLASVAALPAWLSVHLHGAHTGGGNDGWPENGVSRGESQLAEYLNDQPSAALWYHDHAMHVTRFTILSGLLGMYLIRDDEEARLRLPKGRYEVPLIFADRNFALDAAGRLNGRMIHKTSVARPEPAKIMTPFTGPYVTVNGAIWPYFEVEPRWYRFRMLNTCNARVFRFVVLDDQDRVVPDAMRLIGTDAGLLGAPVRVDPWLTLSAAERADVMIDFSAFRGRRVRLVNTRPGTPPGQPDLVNNIVEPNVLEFRVGGRPAPDRTVLPVKLSPSYRRVSAADVPADAPHRMIVLTPPGAPGDPELWEMERVDAADVTVPSDGVVQLRDAEGKLSTYRRIGLFDSGPTMTVTRGTWEIWHFLNIGGPPHPMHVHACRFQPLSRDTFDTSGFDLRHRGTTAPLTHVESGRLESHESGWKDVVRVAAGLERRGELVTVAVQFGHSSGRYVYHCHLLEHEVNMMRAFSVQPAEVLVMGGHGGHTPGGHQHG